MSLTNSIRTGGYAMNILRKIRHLAVGLFLCALLIPGGAAALIEPSIVCESRGTTGWYTVVGDCFAHNCADGYCHGACDGVEFDC